MGVKMGQKWVFRVFLIVPSLESRPFLVPEIEGQMGVKIGQKWGFRVFLKNKRADLVPSPKEGGYCNSRCVPSYSEQEQ